MTSSLAVEPPDHPAFVPRPLTLQSSATLDMLRAFAAWTVMWGHLRAIFFVDFTHLPKRTLVIDALYFITGFGHQAVMVFFVLSGFLISGAIVRRHAAGNLSWRDYSIDRATRLYIVLLPGLLLGLLWDILGERRAPFLYSHPIPAFGNIVPQKQVSLPIFLGNLAFLQTIRFPALGSNGPLWSLSNEFWYYVLFPVLFVAVSALFKRRFARTLLLLVAAATIVIFVGGEIFAGFLIWLSGSLLVRAHTNIRLRSCAARFAFVLCSSVLVALCLTSARFGRPEAFASDFAVGFAFAFFLFAILQFDFRRPPIPIVRAGHFFAGFSYSLYVLHFPFLLFLSVCISPMPRWTPDPRHLFYAVLLGAAVLTYSWVISRLTEVRTPTVRAWTYRLLASTASYLPLKI